MPTATEVGETALTCAGIKTTHANDAATPQQLHVSMHCGRNVALGSSLLVPNVREEGVGGGVAALSPLVRALLAPHNHL
jgi:hypothetical protein